MSTLDQGSSGAQLLSPEAGAVEPVSPMVAGRSLARVCVRAWLPRSQRALGLRRPVQERIASARHGAHRNAGRVVARLDEGPGGGANDDGLYVVDRASGQTRLVARDVYARSGCPKGLSGNGGATMAWCCRIR